MQTLRMKIWRVVLPLVHCPSRDGPAKSGELEKRQLPKMVWISSLASTLCRCWVRQMVLCVPSLDQLEESYWSVSIEGWTSKGRRKSWEWLLDDLEKSLRPWMNTWHPNVFAWTVMYDRLKLYTMAHYFDCVFNFHWEGLCDCMHTFVLSSKRVGLDKWSVRMFLICMYLVVVVTSESTNEFG